MHRSYFRVGEVRVLVREVAQADGPRHEGEDGVPGTPVHRRLTGSAISDRSGLDDGALIKGEEEVGPAAGEAGSDAAYDEGSLGGITKAG